MLARFSPRTSEGRSLLITALLLAALPLAAPSVSAQSADTLSLVWTAPGDDGSVGSAARYEIRMSTAPIDNANWAEAPLIADAPAPLPSGTRQRVTVRGLSRDTTYFFAIKAVDDADNVSSLSNVVRWDWVYDTAPPAAPTGIAAEIENETDGRIRWSPNAEPDVAGYTVYRGESATGPFTAINATLITGTEFLDNQIPAEATQVWYQITATDQSGNEGARSAIVHLSWIEASGVFALHPVYPNPSRGDEPVTIPLDVPLAGPGDAELQIFDQGRRLVRTIDLEGVADGYQLVVWDGRNDAGYACAPGVYSIYLMGTGERHRTKAVRLP